MAASTLQTYQRTLAPQMQTNDQKTQASLILIAQLKLILICRFKELASQDTMNALSYLQTALYEIIDHSDSDSTKEVNFKRK